MDNVALLSGIAGFLLAAGSLLYNIVKGRGDSQAKRVELQLQDRSVTVAEHEASDGRYKDLIDRSDASLERAVLKIEQLEERVSDLEEADAAKSHQIDDANNKIGLLRKMIQSYVDRTGVPLTPDEQATFENTIPSPRLKRPARKSEG